MLTYDLDKFGEHLRLLRKSLGLSITEVSRMTGINESTIKLIEKGRSLPKLDTLYILSRFYKFDLQELLLYSNYNYSLNSYLRAIDQSVLEGDLSSLEEALDTAQSYLGRQDINPIHRSEMVQYEKWLEALTLNAKRGPLASSESIAICCEALSETNKNFKIEHFDAFRYFGVENNILMSIAIMMQEKHQLELSNRILLFLLDHYNGIQFLAKEMRLMVTKIYVYLTRNCIALSQYNDAVKFADAGEQFCLTHDLFQGLPWLLKNKSLALYHLKEHQWQKEWSNALNLLEVQRKWALKDKWESEYLSLLEPF